MTGKYQKPEVKIYSSKDLLEMFGPCQNQYEIPTTTTTTTTFYTTTGNSTVNVDGFADGFNAWPSIIIGVGGTMVDYTRGLFGFNISDIPSGSTITSATLRIYQTSVIFGNPYGLLGDLIVDHVDFGSSMEQGDRDSIALSSNIGTISTTTTTEWKTLPITSYVQTDINDSRTSSQYRLRFETNTTGISIDQVFLEDAENNSATGNRPELVVTYSY